MTSSVPFRRPARICERPSARVEDAVDEAQVTNEVSAVTLPHLTKLSVLFYGREEKIVDSLFSAFDLSHLQHLHFSGYITLPFTQTVNSHQLETLVLFWGEHFLGSFLVFAAAHSSSTQPGTLTPDLRYLYGECF